MKQQSFRIKKLLCRLVFATGVVFVTFVVGKMSLNYMGFCFKEHRFLSDEEKISIAIQYVLGSYPPVIDLYEEQRGLVVKTGISTPAHPIYYKDTDAFLAENLDCCKLTQKMERTKSEFPIQFEHRLLGNANTFVEVRYKVKYIDGNGVERSAIKTRYVAISNCGHSWSGI